MRPGVYRYVSALPKSKRSKRYDPAQLYDPIADYDWLQANPHRLARVHRVELGTKDAPWPMFIIACRVRDRDAPDGWRPAWLEIPHVPFDDTDPPTFATEDWETIVETEDVFKETARVLAVINHAARTRPDALLVRDMLVALRWAELGPSGEDFHFIEND